MRKLGIVGGMGPWAGVDLAAKLISECDADCDQNYVPFVLASVPQETAGRSDFLLDKTAVSPTSGILHALRQLEFLQASVVGIPCNSSHAPQIYSQVALQVDNLGLRLKLLHIVDLVVEHLESYHGDSENIGILSTLGTRLSYIYPATLHRSGFKAVQLNESDAKKLHDAIYDPVYGLKSQPFLPTERARNVVTDCALELIKRGADVVVLACTELPIVITEKLFCGVHIVDSTLILARGMIESVEPSKLKSWLR